MYENRKSHTVGAISKSNIKTVEIDIPNIPIHNRPLSWLGAGT
jgi:hypothetical protein